MHVRTFTFSAAVTSAPEIVAWVLRIATAGCFIGHGAFGVITKAGWLPYFAVASIPEPIAWDLMPWVGFMDIMMGVIVLIFPLRFVVGWCVVWATWTASLRPLSGESIWEFFERAGNFGAPLALLALAGWRGPWGKALTPLRDAFANPTTRREIDGILRLVTATLLIGHAGCNVFDAKPAFLELYQFIVPNATPAMLLKIGLVEFGIALAVLWRPSVKLLLFVGGWKLATEMLWPITGAPFWEFIERFGSYGVPLAYALFLAAQRPLNHSS